jgi:hypothetical protein
MRDMRKRERVGGEERRGEERTKESELRILNTNITCQPTEAPP